MARQDYASSCYSSILGLLADLLERAPLLALLLVAFGISAGFVSSVDDETC